MKLINVFVGLLLPGLILILVAVAIKSPTIMNHSSVLLSITGLVAVVIGVLTVKHLL